MNKKPIVMGVFLIIVCILSLFNHIYLTYQTITADESIETNKLLFNVEFLIISKYDKILIEEEDNTPPNLTIIYPELGLYLFNQKIMNLSNIIIAIGPVDIIAEASDDESGIDYVEYELVRFPTFIMGVFQGESYIYRLSTLSFGRWYVTITAYDNAGNSAVDRIEIWKFL